VDTAIRLVAADLQRTRVAMPSLSSRVEEPEEFGGDLDTQGRQLLKELREGSYEQDGRARMRDAQVLAFAGRLALAGRQAHRAGQLLGRAEPLRTGRFRQERLARHRTDGRE
jgi:hypothetical protein